MDMLVKGFNMLSGGVVGSALNSNVSSRSNFNDAGSATAGLILLLVLVAVIGVGIALLVSVYRLTDNSWLHVILCILLGGVYLVGAFIYYGMSGYRFCKVK
jgi:ABC-type arginine/histidine transport system permease subunit